MKIKLSEVREVLKTRFDTLEEEIEDYEDFDGKLFDCGGKRLDEAIDDLIDAIILLEHLTKRHRRDDRYYSSYRFTKETSDEV